MIFPTMKEFSGFQWKKTKNEFESKLKGFHGDLNLSLSIPNDPELMPLIPLPYDSNMDHEVSNTIIACLEV